MYPQVPHLDGQDLRELTQEKISSAVKKWFSSLEGYTFIITGDFDTETVLPVLSKKLSGFPRKRMHNISLQEFEFSINKDGEKTGMQ